MRDSWLAFPARVGAELAAEPGVDATKLVIALGRSSGANRPSWPTCN
jgi:hypothetical protein